MERRGPGQSDFQASTGGVRASKIVWLILPTRFKVKIVLLTSVLCTLFFSAAAPAQTETTLTANLVYEKNCAKCHGKTAGGRHFGGPALVSEKVASASADDLRSM